MPSAEIIAIGSELLLGETRDSNIFTLAGYFKNIGVDLFQAVIIGDNRERITRSVKEALQRADIVITTGGLGPTIDDPTRPAIADAVNQKLVFQPDLWEQILERFNAYGKSPTENNKRQAFLPEQALPVKNPVGTAPAFMIDIDDKLVISLPGVPKEMTEIFENSIRPFLKDRYKLIDTIFSHVIHTAGIGESQVDMVIEELETLSNPTVGLRAHPGQTDISINAKTDSKEQADKMIKPIRDFIINNLQNDIYGEDEEKLEDVVLKLLEEKKVSPIWLLYGFRDSFLKRLKPIEEDVFPVIPEMDEGTINFEHPETLEELGKEHAIIAWIYKNRTEQTLKVTMTGFGEEFFEIRKFGGHPKLFSEWCENTTLDIVRRKLKEVTL